MKKYIGAIVYDCYPRYVNFFTLDIISATNRRQAEGKLVKLTETLIKRGKRIVNEQLAYLGNENHISTKLDFKSIRHPIKI
jgi:hypothetical protein